MAEQATHITCIEVVELVSDYFEGALSAHEVELFEQHVNFCDGCESYVHQMRIAVKTAGRIGQATVPPDMRERLVAAFRDWKRS